MKCLPDTWEQKGPVFTHGEICVMGVGGAVILFSVRSDTDHVAQMLLSSWKIQEIRVLHRF